MFYIIIYGWWFEGMFYLGFRLSFEFEDEDGGYNVYG